MSKNNDKTKPIFGLDKIPDSAIIKMQAVEIGILKSTIDELTYDLEESRKSIKIETTKDTQDTQIQNRLKNLEAKVETLTKQLEAKRKDYNKLEGEYQTMSRKNVLMEKELFQFLKEKNKS